MSQIQDFPSLDILYIFTASSECCVSKVMEGLQMPFWNLLKAKSKSEIIFSRSFPKFWRWKKEDIVPENFYWTCFAARIEVKLDMEQTLAKWTANFLESQAQPGGGQILSLRHFSIGHSISRRHCFFSEKKERCWCLGKNKVGRNNCVPKVQTLLDFFCRNSVNKQLQKHRGWNL